MHGVDGCHYVALLVEGRDILRTLGKWFFVWLFCHL